MSQVPLLWIQSLSGKSTKESLSILTILKPVIVFKISIEPNPYISAMEMVYKKLLDAINSQISPKFHGQ